MGFTHYFSVKVTKGNAVRDEKRYQQAILDCGKIIAAYQKDCADQGLDDARLSGYSAHCKPGQYGGLNINGKGEMGHEQFTMREHFPENEPSFCKTARKPYDLVVTACLATLKYRLGDAFEVSSDGNPKDWEWGVELARRVLKRKVLNPIKERE